MKRIFYMFCFLLAALSSHAENVFSVDEIDIKQGEEKVISVALTNEENASSAAIDIILPTGLSFVNGSLDGSVVFSDRTAGIMSKTSKIQTSGALRVGMAFGSIPAGSGELFTFKIKADENMDLGTVKIKYSSMALTISSSKVTIPDMESNVNVVKYYSVSVQTDGYIGGSVAITEGTTGDEVKAGSSIQITATPEEGYHFVKWSNDVTDNPYTFTVNSDVTLTATFEPNQYTIVFDSDGGTEVTNITASYKSALTKPADPTKEGYTFAGWDPEFPETMPLNGATLKATWTPITYTISYDLAGGALADGVTNAVSYTIESDAITLNNPIREGYTFAGWSGTGLMEATMEVIIAKGSMGNRSYTATWTPITYTISYDLAGGSLADGVANAVSYTIESDAITLNNPSREGYTFAGWTGTGLTEATMEVVIAKGSMGDRSYTATWTPITYTISYDLAGGALADGVTNAVSYTIESDAITLNNPIREGYTFAGWTGTDLTEATMEVVIAKGSIGDRSYTATWTVNFYTLKFVVDGEVIIEERVAFDSPIITPQNPEKEGYTFTGWDANVPEKMPATDLTFTAQFVINKYNVIYIVNGQEWARDEVTYNEPIVLREYTPQAGELFMGWVSDQEYILMPAHDVTYTANISPATGIYAVFKDGKKVDVYTLSGTLVGRQLSADDVQKLRKGIYLINGKKISVK